MKHLLLSVGVAAMLAAPVAARAAEPNHARATASQKKLDQRIEQRFKADASLKNYDLDVSVSGHVATLTGKVASERERMRAGRLARVSGITRVDNQITVDANATKGTTGRLMDKTGEKSKEAGEAVKSGAGKVGEKSKEAVSKTGEVITDGWITTKVHSHFMGEDLLKGSDINVDTNNHVVTLKGTVASEAGRARAVAIARDTEGVQKVIDQLTIAPKK